MVILVLRLSGEQLREDRGPSLRAYNVVMIVIPMVAIVVRFWSRGLSDRDGYGRYWWDDWTALAALPFCVASNSLVIEMVRFGLGRHNVTLPQEYVLQIMKLGFATHIVYDTGLTLARASALLFYARVFESFSKKFNFALWASHLLLWAWWFGVVFGLVFMCNPVHKYWMRTAPGSCGNIGALWLGGAIPSTIIDLVILILPLPKLWGLRLPLARKIATCGVFVCGYCVVVLSIGRLVILVKEEQGLDQNFNLAGIDVMFWLGAEIPITILSICLPSLFFLYRRVRHHGVRSLFSTRVGSSRIPFRDCPSNNLDPRSLRDRHRYSQELQKTPGGPGGSEEQLHVDSSVHARNNKAVTISIRIERGDLESQQNTDSELHVSNELSVTIS